MALDTRVLETFPFPPDVKFELKELGMPNSIIQRVSQTSFVIRIKEKTIQHPLKLLHIRIDGQGKIHCQCSEYKSTSTLSAVHTSLRLSKRCIHFYCCLWAMLSNPSLQSEFSLQLCHATTGKLLINMHY